MENIKPLNITVTRCVITGQMYDLMSYEEFCKQKEFIPNTAILEEYNGQKIVLPNRGEFNAQSSNPGIYKAGCIDFVIYPTPDNIGNYIPSKIIDMSNTTPIKEMLERKDIMAKLDEPWITSPDNITQFNIVEADKPEMKCLKTALNKKHVDIDKYSARFGDNFPNDKRQLKNNSATLNIIKRYCEHMDMEALLTLRDKNPNVPNPIGSEITVSLTENYSEDEENE